MGHALSSSSNDDTDAAGNRRPSPRSPRRLLTPRDGEALASKGEVCKIKPGDSVYSFLMFTLPLEQQKSEGQWSWRCFTAVALVLVTLIIKGILLYAIFKAVVMKDIRWQNSILQTEDPLTQNYFTGAAPPKCNTDASLCTWRDGQYTCAPPTVQLMGRWNELDTNGDGVWTREEAEASRDALKCKYVVDPLEVFDVFVTFVMNREDNIWIHPDLQAGRSIHKAYFTYASGDLIMCGYRTKKMCANLLQRGVFDAPLREGTAPRVGTTIDSALDYCYALLEEGGKCERYLPSTYSVWKHYSDGQCWESEFSKFVYKHPKSGQEKSLLAVEYDAPEAYGRLAKDDLFGIYQGIIIMLFLLAMYAELKDVNTTCMWCMNYPGLEDIEGGEEVVETVDPETHQTVLKIQCISSYHRYVIGFVCLLRFLMICLLIWVGVSFLMRDTDWVNLLLNGVALVFVMEVANHVFSQVLDPRVQEQFLDMAPMYVNMPGRPASKWFKGHLALRDLLGFILLCLFLYGVMAVHRAHVDIPIAEAVECACMSDGPKCREAAMFDSSFWQQYWTQDVPGVYSTIEKLKVAEAHGRTVSEIKADESEVDRREAAPTPAPTRSGADTDTDADGADEERPTPKPQKKEAAAAKKVLKHGVRWNIVSASRKHSASKSRQRRARKSRRKMVNTEDKKRSHLAAIATLSSGSYG